MSLAAFGTLILGTALLAEAQFDRNYVGVAFSPYIDPLPGRAWNAYKVEDIQRMLSVVRTKFESISTYSMGVSPNNRGKSWDQADSNALVARAAARLNTQRVANRLKVNIGVYQDGLDGSDRQREIDNAYAAAADANRISPGTVWGVTFTNEYINSVARANEVLQMVNKNRGRNGLQVGTRTQFCNYISDQGELGQRFKDIVRGSGFIYCNVYASPEHSRMGPERAAKEVMNYFLGLRNQIKGVNGNIDVQIGETGWPSAGNSFNDSDNTVQNLRKYWAAFARLARDNRVKVQMFQAIDEPWKARDSKFKAEGKYGLWYKPNNNSDKLVEKK